MKTEKVLPKNSFKWFPINRIVLITAIFLLLGTVSLVYKARSFANTIAPVQPIPAPTQTEPEPMVHDYLPETTSTPTIISTLPFILEENGLTLTNISLTPNKYFLVVHNETMSDVILQLKSSSGEVIRELYVYAKPSSKAVVIDLPVGSYELIGVNRPMYKCQITVSQ